MHRKYCEIKEEEAKRPSLSNKERLTNSMISSLDSKNRVGAHLCVPGQLVVFWVSSPIKFGGVFMKTPKSWPWPRAVKFPKKLVGTFQRKLY